MEDWQLSIDNPHFTESFLEEFEAPFNNLNLLHCEIAQEEYQQPSSFELMQSFDPNPYSPDQPSGAWHDEFSEYFGNNPATQAAFEHEFGSTGGEISYEKSMLDLIYGDHAYAKLQPIDNDTTLNNSAPNYPTAASGFNQEMAGNHNVNYANRIVNEALIDDMDLD